MPACTLRPAGAADAEFLFHLYAQTRAEELARTGWTASQLDTFLRQQLTARDAHYRACYPAADNLVVQRNGQDAGRLLIDRGVEAIRLVDIALLPEHRGHGLGSVLLRELQLEALRTQRPLLLHVERHNRARGLYRRLGFAETDTQGLHLAMRWPGPAAAPELPCGGPPSLARAALTNRTALPSHPTGEQP